MTHALFAPSAAHRWLVCPGSVRLSASAPARPPSVYAEEGSRMHEYAARCLVENLDPLEHAPENMEQTAVAAVCSYVAYIRSTFKRVSWEEVELALTYDEYLGGTLDYAAVSGSTLHVLDFKGGVGVAVEAIGNPQLLTYAWLVLVAFKERLSAVRRVRLTIVQPRVKTGMLVSHQEIDVLELVSWGQRIKAAVRAATMPSPTYQTGDHCRWCPAMLVCPAVKHAIEGSDPWGNAIPEKELPAQLERAEVLELWIAGVREHAVNVLNNGGKIEGWILRPTRAIRKWIDERAAEARLRVLGVEPFEQSLISVATADKALKGRFGELALLWSAVSSGYVLARGAAPSLEAKGTLIEKQLQ